MDRAAALRWEAAADLDGEISRSEERGRTVHAAVRVVETATRRRDHPTAPELTERMLRLLERLTRDPDPSRSADAASAEEPSVQPLIAKSA